MMNVSSTADQILACARSLIISGGYNGFSYADIADVVGIRKPSIHHHFASKVELVRAVVSRYRQEAEAGVADLERHVADPVEQLSGYVKFWEKCITDSSASFCVCALLASELPALPPEVALEVRGHFRALSAWVTSVLQRGARQGRFQLASKANVEAEALIATVHGAMLSARAYGDPKMFGIITTPLLRRLTTLD
ncbi:TetR/AcrR family transcriptional regulator [Bradyrhizobium sp. HKCCYLS20291]|uniref:TetR/AcrR family transcriptional regulator n=1 Tax=Bradyrhizobium sp. HKCCYLS20291 TaxID=3420766 RepID=UPI003EBF0B8B